MWHNNQSIAGQFLDSSGGFFFNDNTTATRRSNVVSVPIASDYRDLGCSASLWRTQADKNATAMGIVLTDYTFR